MASTASPTVALKAFIPTHRHPDYADEQRALFREKKLRMAKADVPAGFADGDLVELSTDHGTTTLRLDATGDKQGWISLSYEAAKALGSKSKESQLFHFARPATAEAAQSRHDVEVKAAQSYSATDVMRRLDELADSMAVVDLRTQQTLTHSTAHRDDTARASRSGTRLALVLFALGLLVTLGLWWMG